MMCSKELIVSDLTAKEPHQSWQYRISPKHLKVYLHHHTNRKLKQKQSSNTNTNTIYSSKKAEYTITKLAKNIDSIKSTPIEDSSSEEETMVIMCLRILVGMLLAYGGFGVALTVL